MTDYEPLTKDELSKLEPGEVIGYGEGNYLIISEVDFDREGVSGRIVSHFEGVNGVRIEDLVKQGAFRVTRKV